MSAQTTAWTDLIEGDALGASTDVYALVRLLASHGVHVQHAHDSTLHLAAADVCELTCAAAEPVPGSQALLVSTFLGLTGATSPLPQESLAALEEAMSADGGEQLAAWLAELHHRLLELLHEGVNRAQPGTCATTRLDDVVSRQLLEASAHAAQLLPRPLRLAARAVLSKPCCSAVDTAWAVRRVLRHHGLDCDVQCTPLTGGAAPLPPQETWMLGRGPSALGKTCVLGQYAHVPTARIAVQLGAVGLHWIDACSPQHASVASQLWGMLRAALPPQVGADVAVVLEGDALTPLQLGAADGVVSMQSPFVGLGANVFLGTPPARQAVPWPLAAAEYCCEGAIDVASD